MEREALIELMLGLLQNSLNDQNENMVVQAEAEMPLIGESAALTSLRLVSLIADIESAIADGFGIDLTLVSEKALLRKRSPFRSLDALADYIMETVAQPSSVMA